MPVSLVVNKLGYERALVLEGHLALADTPIVHKLPLVQITILEPVLSSPVTLTVLEIPLVILPIGIEHLDLSVIDLSLYEACLDHFPRWTIQEAQTIRVVIPPFTSVEDTCLFEETDTIAMTHVISESTLVEITCDWIHNGTLAML